MIANYIHYLFVFILAWWITFFIVLPFGIEIPDTQNDAKWASSAPSNPNILVKIFVTTALSIIITFGYHLIIFS